jgi:Carboxypeptidase regulatory-like domain/TonB dependent receptor
MNASWKFTNGLLGFVVLLLVSVGTSFAQSTATLAGTVTDPTGAVVPNASVKVRSLATNVLRETVSDSAGAYVLPSLQPGDYEIRTTAAGFGTSVIKSVTLLVDQSVTANVKLNVQSSGETVQVEAGAAPIIDSQTITMGQVIDKETVQNIPLNGRHFLDLTNLTPGAVVPPANGFLTSASRGLGANSYITGGAREDANNFQINGINLNDMTQNQITFQPSINTTSEFKIINSTFGAEYGRSSGSVVNVATRSGASTYHGEAFDYLRNNYFDARNYFNRRGSLPQNRQNQFIRNNFGGALSGPVPFILKDKAFLFLSYEGLRQTQALLLTSNVPTLAQRALFANSAAGLAYAKLITLIPVGVETTTIDPNTGKPVTTAVATGSSPGPVKTDQYSGDLLLNLSTVNSLHMYYAWQQDARTEPNLQGNTIAGFGDHRTAHRQIGTINDVHIFSPSVVNEARFGFNRIAINFADSFTAVSSDYGIPNGVTAAIGLPQITVTDLGLNFGGPSGFPQGRFVTTGVFSDTLNYLKSKHSIKIGGEFRRFEGNNFSNTAGTVNFTTTANFISGTTNTFTANSINPVSNRIFISAVAAFAEDSYKVTPTLTLEYGLRYEWNGTPAEGGHRFVTFNPSTSAFQQVNQPYKQNNNYEPRLGFIYDVSGKGKTTIRGGFGYLVDQPITSVVTGLASNPPFSNPLQTTGAPIGTAFASAGASGLNPNSVNPNFKNGYIESYNLNVQQELGPASALQVGYIGSQGRHLRLNHNINQRVYASPTTATFTLPYPTAKMLDGSVRPLGNINDNDSIGMSNYNALWVTYRRSLRGGLQFNTTYTYAKSMDENSQSGNGIQDNTNPAGSYGLSDFDVRHHFVFSGTWTLPFHGNRLKDGWLIADVTQIQGGNPLNVVTGSTYSGASGNIRPTLLVRPSTGVHKALSNFSIPYIVGTSCLTATQGCNFLTPTLGYGSMQRNGLTGPGFSDTDVSLQKTTKIAESVNFILRMDAFDVFNQANFGNPVLTASPTSTTFGTITATRGAIGDAGSSRQLQFAAKVQF